MALFGFERLPPLQKVKSLVLFFIARRKCLSVIAGCVITALIQSYCNDCIAMDFAGYAISLPAAMVSCFGSNIGTCLDAYVASLGGGKKLRKQHGPTFAERFRCRDFYSIYISIFTNVPYSPQMR